MLKFKVYQQRMTESFLSEGVVTARDGELREVGYVVAHSGSHAIDLARTLPAFKGWLKSRLEAWPVVGLA